MIQHSMSPVSCLELVVCFQTPLLVCWLFTANSFFLLCFFLAFLLCSAFLTFDPAQLA